jgi:hypothetical protein
LFSQTEHIEHFVVSEVEDKFVSIPGHVQLISFESLTHSLTHLPACLPGNAAPTSERRSTWMMARETPERQASTLTTGELRCAVGAGSAEDKRSNGSNETRSAEEKSRIEEQ